MREPVAVVGDPGSHGPCGPRAIARSLSTFLDAFNRGDRAGLGRLFGPEFKWFTIDEPTRHGIVIFTRGVAVPTLLARQRAGERMHLVMVGTTRFTSGFTDATIVLRRTAPDIGPGVGGGYHLAAGKAEYSCPEQRIVITSLGMDTNGTTVPWPCRMPTRWTPASSTAIACLRN